VGQDWKRAESLSDPLCVHLMRDGAVIAVTRSDGRRVRHPDFGGWLLLSALGGGRYAAHGQMYGKHARHAAVAHRASEPCEVIRG
jgi:hypothetical protein